MKKILGIILAATLFWGSVTSGMANERGREKIQLTFMATGTGNYGKEREEELENILLEEFPNIEIHVEAYPDEQYYSTLNTRLSMGEGPDFFNIQPYWAGPNAVRKLAKAGYLEPLETLPVFRNVPEENTNPVSYEGHIYSISRGDMILCTYYNKEIFEKYGISIPKNWTEFLSVCEMLRQKGITPIISGNKDTYALQFGLYQLAACQIYAEHLDFNRDLEDGTASFQDPGTWDKVLKQYLSLYEKGYVQKKSLAMSGSEAVKRFTNGEGAMMFGGNFSYSALKAQMDEETLGAFPLPGNTAGKPIYGVLSYGGGMAVYAGGEHVELCKKIFQKLYESENFSTESDTDKIWAPFYELKKSGYYTINCNQGWRGDVEWVMENGLSKRIGGEDISVEEITNEMQEAYDKN